MRRTFETAVSDSLQDRVAKRQGVVTCIAHGFGLPAMTDFESRCVESGMAVCALGDLGMLGHGRFAVVEAHKRKIVTVVFAVRSEMAQMQWLIKGLQERGMVVPVLAPVDGAQGLLYLFARSIFLADRMKEGQFDVAGLESLAWGKRLLAEAGRP